MHQLSNKHTPWVAIANIWLGNRSLLTNLFAGTPLVFVVSGLASRTEHYGVRDEDGELAL